MTEAMADAGGFFPPLACEMVDVGEQTGKLAEVFLRLADHYDHAISLRRSFLVGIIWPAIQLGLAVGIIGVLIWVMGIVNDGAGDEPIDALGLGLYGTRGLLIYSGVVAGVAILGTVVVVGTVRGWFWTGPLMLAVTHSPILGRCIKTAALARMAWSLAMAIESGTDARGAVRAAIRSTQNRHFTRHTEAVDRQIASGCEIHRALRTTGAFPDDLLDALEVAEQSGRVVESMTDLSSRSQDQAQSSSGVLTMLAALAAWGLVALLIIALIFRLAMFYIGSIYEALEMV